MIPYSKNIIMACLISAFFLFSCKPRLVNEAELKTYVLNPSNGLIKENSVGNYKVKISYRPTGLLLAQEMKTMNGVTDEKVKALQYNYQKHLYFILSMSEKGHEIANTSLNFENSIKQLSFGMGNYVSLITSSKDTIPVADFIYPRMYGGTGATQCMFLFSRDKIKNAEYLDFHLKDFGMGIENMQFRFKRKDIENVPVLDAFKKSNAKF